MSPLAYVDYSFILVFFAVLLGSVLLLARSEEKKAGVQKSSAMSQKQRQNMLGYGVLATLFVMFVLITFLTRKVSSTST